MKTIHLTIKEKNITLTLKDDEDVVDEKKWADENNLSEKFLPHLDELLKANALSIDDIADFQLENGIPAGYTTARIARTIITTLNFANNF